MAEETPKTATPDAPASATPEPVATSEAQLAGKAPEPEPAAAEEAKPKEEVKKIGESASFKEETNVVGELPEPQKKALYDLKQLVQDALNKHELSSPPPPVIEKEKPAPAAVEKETPKTEEPKTEETTHAPAPAEGVTPPPPSLVEEQKAAPPAVEEKVAPVVEADKGAPPAETTEPVTVVPEVVEEKSASVDDDGAKTVEAIKETIVSVSAPAESEAPAPVAEEPKESKAPAAAEAGAGAPPPAPEAVSIWGIPLLADERSDVVLLKFLRARDFKVKEAFAMLRNTVRWRQEFKIDTLLEEDLGTELDKVVFIHGVDKEGHPVCYNAYGEFQNKELYQSTFADEEKREKFLRWRIQFLEKTIRKELDFSPGGVCTFFQVNDLKASPGVMKREHRVATNRALQLLQDNYPEFVAKQVFINVPWWYLAFYRMISPFFTQRTKSKFFFAGPSKSAETLFKYIAPEQVPVQYGGLSKEGEQEFTTADTVTEEIVKPATKHTVEFLVSEACTLVWEVRVIGWDVSYGSEFVPGAEGGYTVIIQKLRKIMPADETVVSGSFKVSEAGKVILTIDNSDSSKKKKLLYRSKTKP